MDAPFAPYEGDRPYVFVSYAHSDNRKVLGELGWLHDNGILFWYDEGISAGADWRDTIGNAIVGSTLCVFFVSTQSVRSEHCVREVKLALDNNIPVLPIYLESADLPAGLALALGNVQAILRFKLPAAQYERRTVNALRTALGADDTAITKRRSFRGQIVAAIAAALAIATAIGAALILSAPGQPDSRAAVDVSIAVLPFTHLKGNEQRNEERVDSIAGALTLSVASALVGAGNVPVISMDSSRRLAGHPDDEIANRLGVSHVVRGIVQNAGERLRVTVSLTAVESGITAWSQEFTGSAGNLFELQDDVSLSVSDASVTHLAIQPTARSAPPQSAQPVAYNLYLDAMALDTRFPDENRSAIRMLEQVVELEPDFVNARVELAFAYWRTSTVPRVNKERVKAELRAAVARQPRHGAANALLGTIVARCDYDWTRGFERLRAAHEDYPFDARVQALWAHHLGSIHHPDAPQASEAAYRLDPLSGPAVEDYARSLVVRGRQLDALQVRSNYLDMARSARIADPVTIGMQIAQGQLDEAASGIVSLGQHFGAAHPTTRVLEMQLALARQDFETAMSIERELMVRHQNEHIPLGIGSPGTIATRLRQAVQQRDPQVVFALLAQRPQSITEEDWEKLRESVRVHDILTPTVASYRARSRDEIEQLFASERPASASDIARITGAWEAPTFPTLTFEQRDGRLTFADFDVRLIQVAPDVFVQAPLKGYRYEFSGDTLIAWDGQIRREYHRRK